MPLIPAMRPLTISSMAADRPIIMPPASDGQMPPARSWCADDCEHGTGAPRGRNLDPWKTGGGLGVLATERAQYGDEDWALRAIRQPVENGACPPPCCHQTGVTQRAEMLRQRRLAKVQFLLDGAHAGFAVEQPRQDAKPCRIGHGAQQDSGLFRYHGVAPAASDSFTVR